MMEEELRKSTKLIPENERRYLTEYVKKDLDLFYVNKIVGEMLKSIRRYEGRDAILEDYGKLVAFVVKKMENDKFLKGMDERKKHLVVREINRIFSEKFENVSEYKENIQRVTAFRLQDLKREVVSTTQFSPHFDRKTQAGKPGS
jgi:uncharacterized membrane-anchored protein YjiN (DUF445 family)